MAKSQPRFGVSRSNKLRLTKTTARSNLAGRTARKVKVPFSFGLINGMRPNTAELTVIVRSVRRNARSGHFELYLGKLVNVRHWNLKRQQPLRDELSLPTLVREHFEKYERPTY